MCEEADERERRLRYFIEQKYRVGEWHLTRHANYV